MNEFPQIPGYTIDYPLGEGGMATVYRGTQHKLNRTVAIKVLDPSLLPRMNLAARFLNEAQTAARLYHTHIVSIYDVGTVGSIHYIVMEYLDKSLKDRMNEAPGNRLSPREVFDIIKKVSIALDYAHSQGIIHRDIKPDNIMFRKDGTPVLVDFGIARVMDTESNMTRTGMSIGTPHYMSPEQCRAEAIDGRSDFYSLGVVLYEVLMGKKPYEAETTVGVALKHIQEPIPEFPQPLRRFQPLLNRLMAKNREERVQNGVELIRLIDQNMMGAVSQKASTDTATDKRGETPVMVKPPDVLPEEEEKTLFALSLDQAVEEVPERPQKGVTEQVPVSKTGESRTNLSGSASAEKMGTGMREASPGVGGGTSTGRMKTVPAATVVQRNTGMQRAYVQNANRPSGIRQIVGAVVLALLLVFIFVYFFLQGFRSKSEVSESRPIASVNQSVVKQPEVIPEKESPESLSGSGGPVDSFDQMVAAATDHFNNQRYREAQAAVVEARRIKNSPELDALDQKINQALTTISKPGKTGIGLRPSEAVRDSGQSSDDVAYQKAVAQNTVAAYQTYMDQYPAGRHFDEAIVKVNLLKEPANVGSSKKISGSVKRLRNGYINLTFEDVEGIVRRLGYYEGSFNKSGRVRGNWVLQTIKSETVVLDQVTGLMWHSSGSPKPIKYSKARKWIASMNKKGYGGYTDWRLPTLEEALSLLVGSRNAGGLYIDAMFDSRQAEIWTGDGFGSTQLWALRYNEGIVYTFSDESELYIRPVRTAQ